MLALLPPLINIPEYEAEVLHAFNSISWSFILVFSVYTVVVEPFTCKLPLTVKLPLKLRSVPSNVKLEEP